MFNSKTKNFGVLKVLGSTVRLFESRSQYSTISVGREIEDARWVGDAVIVKLAEGGVRRYVTLSQYQNI